jgi:hypothetical protein
LAAAAPGLDAAATGAGLSAADIGGSFASLAAAPLADFAGTAAGALGTGVPGSTTAAAPLATTAAAPASTTGAAVGGGASTGSAAAAAAPASAAASPTTTGILGSVDPSLIETASAPAGLSGDTAATALGASGAPTGLASATGTAAAAAPTASTGAGLLGSLKTWGPLAISGGGLLTSMLEGSQKPAFEGQLQSQAAAMAKQGAQLENYLTSGTLPPGVQSGLTQAYNSAAATIRSQYAQRGQTGSSAEMQDLANLSATTVAQGAQIATNLLQQGVSESEFSAQLYSQLMQASMQQDAALSKSIADFSGSLAGMGLRSVG